MSRNTVRKVIRSGATEFTYDRTTQPRPKIGPWRSGLDDMLAENARRPKRDRLTLIRIFEELCNRGCDCSYGAVRRYAASWSKATQEASASAYVPLSFDPGEVCPFDWSHEIVILDGVTTTVKAGRREGWGGTKLGGKGAAACRTNMYHVVPFRPAGDGEHLGA